MVTIILAIFVLGFLSYISGYSLNYKDDKDGVDTTASDEFTEENENNE